jgi:TonB-linked SusC/RagA family outer membrane protein
LLLNLNLNFMKRLAMFLAFFLCVGLLSTMAQNVQIKGTVTGSEDGQPLVGASVQVKGTNIGSVTDAQGKYTLSVPSDAKTLVVSFIGMKNQEIEIGGKTVIDAAMEPDATALNEVVVVATALGIRRQEREIGYAATTVKSSLITQANSTDVQQALNGKISGLNITTTNSGVFEDSKINIRGIRSLTGNNQPMLVLDGAPVSLGYLSSIAPEDIQDVTVLKSAASAALYGPDAVNGVILVTTKKGSAGKPIVTVTSSIQASRVAYFPKMQHDFGGYGGEGAPYLDEFGNALYVPIENQLYGPKFDGTIKPIGIVDEQGHQQSGPYSNLHWKDKVNFWNTGMTFQNGASISTKDYFFSITNADIKGLMPDDKNNRTTLRFNSGKEYKNLSINYNVSYTRNDWDVVNEADFPNLTTSSYVGSVMSNVFQVGDNVPLLSYKDLNSEWGKFDNYFCEYAFNPYWLIANVRQKGTSHDILGSIDITYKFAEWLKANVRTSSTINLTSYKNTDGPISVSDYTLNVLQRNSTQYHNQPGLEFDDSYNTSRINVDAFLSGEVNSGNLSFKYIAGTTTRSNYYKDIAMGGNNLSVNGLDNIAVRSGDANVPGANLIDPVSGNRFNAIVRSRLVSAYGNLTLAYKKFIYLDLTGRNDWDSRLPAANRSVFYPGASLAIIASDIIPSLKEGVINFLKLRAALNKSGNVNLNPYSTQVTYPVPLPSGYSTSNPGFPYGNNVGFTTGNTYPSPNLKPEFVTTIEGGFELHMLKNRVSFDGTYYHQNNTNQVLTVSESWTTGYPYSLANAASFKNYGVDMELGLTPLISIGKGNINLQINASYNDNEVTQTLNNQPVVLNGSSNFIQGAAANPTVNNIAEVGKPAYKFQLTDYNRDPSGRVIVDANGNPQEATNMIVTGRTLPVWIIGFNPSFTIGNFSFAMTWDYKTGHNFYAGVGPDMDFSGVSARSAEYGRQRFVFPNSVYLQNGQYVPNTNRLVSDGNYGFWTTKATNTGVATNYYCSAAAIKLREVNITYNLPNKLLGRTKFIRNASVSLVGKNLLMFLPKSNQWGDPEFTYSSTDNTYGVSSAYQTPASRFYGATVTLQF